MESVYRRAGQVIVIDFEVRDLEAADGFDRSRKRVFGCLRPSRLPQATLCVAKRPQHLFAVEPLSLAVFAEAHYCHLAILARLSPSCRRSGNLGNENLVASYILSDRDVQYLDEQGGRRAPSEAFSVVIP